jgi:hypothetical protein
MRDPLLHFQCRFVGKRDGQDPIGCGFVLYKICYSEGDHTGFAGSSSSENQ